MDYWEECISIAADECELKLTEAQRKYLAEAVEGAHENYSMAFGHDVIGTPIETQAQRELLELKRKIEQEELWKLSTVPCRTCTTTGLVKDGWGRDVTCHDCGGSGRRRS